MIHRNAAGRLTLVSMNGGAQTRTFVYNQYNQVTFATNPENGTVTYSQVAAATPCRPAAAGRRYVMARHYRPRHPVLWFA